MKRHCPGKSGFTLMELLISITILSVIVLLVLSALRISTNAWEKGEENIESRQRVRAVVEMLIGQIEAIRTDRKYVGEDDAYYIKGDSNELSFVTESPSGYDGETKSVHVAYSVKKEDSGAQLLLTERNIPILPPLSESVAAEVEENTIPLLSEWGDIRFEYLKSLTNEEGPQWQETWNPAEETGVPLAVRIALRESEADSPVRAIARIIRDPTRKVNYQWNVN